MDAFVTAVREMVQSFSASEMVIALVAGSVLSLLFLSLLVDLLAEARLRFIHAAFFPKGPTHADPVRIRLETARAVDRLAGREQCAVSADGEGRVPAAHRGIPLVGATPGRAATAARPVLWLVDGDAPYGTGAHLVHRPEQRSQKRVEPWLTGGDVA